MHNPVFEICKAGDGHYYFRYRTSDGKIIYTSGTYVSKQGAENGIAAARKGTAEAPVQDNTRQQMPNQSYDS